MHVQAIVVSPPPLSKLPLSVAKIVQGTEPTPISPSFQFPSPPPCSFGISFGNRLPIGSSLSGPESSQTIAKRWLK